MNWDNLRFFLAVTRTGGVRPAAASLAVDQATVARRLRALEAEAGVTLFHRRPEGYLLTPPGEALVAEADAMEAAAAAFARKAAGTDTALSGPVRIATTDVLARRFVLPALVGLRRRHPGIAAIVSAGVRLSDMRHGAADIALRSERPRDEGLIVRHLHTTTVGLYASADYVARHGIPVRGVAFAGHSLVMYGRRDLPRHWQALCGEPITQAEIALETDSQSLLIDAVRTGLGIGALSRDIVAANYPELVAVMSGCTETADIWLVVHPDVHGSARVRVVVDAIAQAFKDQAERANPKGRRR